ncbi:hypothetical protein J4424_05135 [Candidatus Woesearchaeota archaeon]|nr:hypothetical protein [Candidatus Woesearchaeota archaeon]HIJ05215.1 hypothetical protein [Nanoarchaeota archaeon]
MNKKGVGEHPFFLAMEAMLGILVAGILISAATNSDSISNVNKIYAGEDLKLLTETIQAAPGEIEYQYRLKDIYQVNIKGKEIQVVQTTNFLESYSYYNLMLTKEGNQVRMEKNA